MRVMCSSVFICPNWVSIFLVIFIRSKLFPTSSPCYVCHIPLLSESVSLLRPAEVIV